MQCETYYFWLNIPGCTSSLNYDFIALIRYDDAIPDFEAVLKLNKDMAVAHVSLGLIYMLKMENHHR